MRKITSELKAGKYKVLKLDGARPNIRYSKYVIGGKEYGIVPIYDAIDCIAVESSDSFEGKTVEFK